MVYVVVCYNGKGPPKVSECIHYQPLSREQMSVIIPVTLSETFAGIFFKMELAFLYYLFFEMHPLSLALIFHSFLILSVFIFIPFIPLEQLSSKCNAAFLYYSFFFLKCNFHLCPHFPLFYFLKK